MVGCEHYGAFVTTGKEHGAGIGVIHLRRITPHQRQHFNGRGVFDLHAFDQFTEAVECGALVFKNMRGFGHRRARNDKRSGSPQHFLSGPKVMGVQAIHGCRERASIKYYDRRECGHV